MKVYLVFNVVRKDFGPGHDEIVDSIYDNEKSAYIRVGELMEKERYIVAFVRDMVVKG